MLPLDYPDDFEHRGLLDVWFEGIPWSVQSRVLRVENRLRCVRNPVTQVFVVVQKLNPEDPHQVHNFFAVARLVGWVPIVETKRGLPVEAIYGICEAMERSARQFDEKYGTTPAQIEAALAAERRAAKVADEDAMRATSKFATEFTRNFLETASSMKQGMTPGRRTRMFKGAHKELLRELDKREGAKRKPVGSLVVPA